jgi:hypothetical protein
MSWFLGVEDPQHVVMGYVGTWEIRLTGNGMPQTRKEISNKRGWKVSRKSDVSVVVRKRMNKIVSNRWRNSWSEE